MLRSTFIRLPMRIPELAVEFTGLPDVLRRLQFRICLWFN